MTDNVTSDNKIVQEDVSAEAFCNAVIEATEVFLTFSQTNM